MMRLSNDMGSGAGGVFQPEAVEKANSRGKSVAWVASDAKIRIDPKLKLATTNLERHGVVSARRA